MCHISAEKILIYFDVYGRIIAQKWTEWSCYKNVFTGNEKTFVSWMTYVWTLYYLTKTVMGGSMT